MDGTGCLWNRGSPTDSFTQPNIESTGFLTSASSFNSSISKGFTPVFPAVRVDLKINRYAHVSSSESS